MKKFAFIVMGLSAGIFMGTLAFAEDQEMQMPGQHQERRGMHKQPSMVATSDGGVIVLSGPKLAKYDSQLNLVKEVELKAGPKPLDKAGESEVLPVSNTPPALDTPPAPAAIPAEPAVQPTEPSSAELEKALQSQEAGQ